MPSRIFGDVVKSVMAIAYVGKWGIITHFGNMGNALYAYKNIKQKIAYIQRYMPFLFTLIYFEFNKPLKNTPIAQISSYDFKPVGVLGNGNTAIIVPLSLTL